MKKTLLVLVGGALLGTASAQEVYKQAAGDKNLEVQFAPLGGTPISIGGIRFRSFSSETSAIRVNIFLGSNSKTTVTQQLNDTATTAGSIHQNELKDKESTFSFNIRPGIEKHMTGTDRLSPYMGAELDFGMTMHTEKVQTEGKAGTHFDAPTSGTFLPEIYTKTTKGSKGYMTVGANLVAGADYYFTKKAYLGAELGFGVSMKKESKVKVEDEDAAAAATKAGVTYNDPDPTKQGGTFGFGPTVNGQIRLGFLF